MWKNSKSWARRSIRQTVDGSLGQTGFVTDAMENWSIRIFTPAAPCPCSAGH